MDVSIIIVNFNTEQLVVDCLSSIFEHSADIDYEVIVVDNNSMDDSCSAIKLSFPQVKLIESGINLGFGNANNLAAKIALGKYYFFLNSDCVLKNNAVKIFYDYMECNNADNSIGAVGSLLLSENNTLNVSYHKFPNIRNVFIGPASFVLNKFFRIRIKSLPKTNYITDLKHGEVDFIVGAALFVKQSIFQKLDGFDKDFFLFFEETDLQMRMSRNGLKRLIINGPKIIHKNGSTTTNLNNKLLVKSFYVDSMYTFFRKNYSLPYYILFYIVVTPIISTPLLNKHYTIEDKMKYLRVLMRKAIY